MVKRLRKQFSGWQVQVLVLSKLPVIKDSNRPPIAVLASRAKVQPAMAEAKLIRVQALTQGKRQGLTGHFACDLAQCVAFEFDQVINRKLFLFELTN